VPIPKRKAIQTFPALYVFDFFSASSPGTPKLPKLLRHRAALERTRELMDSATRDCLVSGYESLIPSLELPDSEDRHVLAAAIVGHCDVIVTQNLKHFPDAALAPYGIDVQHPDEFFCNHLNLAQGLFCSAIQRVRHRLKNPPYTINEYLDTLTQNGLVATAAELRPFAALL
jgi:hypothetical protein